MGILRHRVIEACERAVLKVPRGILLALVSGFWIANLPVAARAGGGEAGSLSEAKEIYMQACGACHGADARGHGPLAAALIKAPADLTRLNAGHGGVFPKDDFIAIVAGERTVLGHGTRELPVWTQRFASSSGGSTGVASIYARRRLDLLAGFVESVQREDESPTPAATP